MRVSARDSARVCMWARVWVSVGVRVQSGGYASRGGHHLIRLVALRAAVLTMECELVSFRI